MGGGTSLKSTDGHERVNDLGRVTPAPGAADGEPDSPYNAELPDGALTFVLRTRSSGGG